jgi:hypothetical protein
MINHGAEPTCDGPFMPDGGDVYHNLLRRAHQ